ncbi:uncharacterized protein RCC_06677 [Ramularia collo-cygni]|uniref:HTH APSES-type domain-containing protein n=1 Tax=Ramularia collo-cygni TaxID=112498 RepID=A0A2D3VG28_9PEZI|nr:uncharacterized protein RCC_06677 [Ramularia collo-cygni]CZT20819.1 uncharacterized protein RCC_06677 [Ramularia collo-cygni]
MSDNSALLAASSARPATPIYNPHASTPTATLQPEAPVQSPAKRSKLVKDAAVFIRSNVTGPINYPPYECSDDSPHISAELSQELAEYHQMYRIHPSALGGDKISDFARHIPYSSEKKTFLNKTGRDAFDVFQYTFIVPGDAEQRQHVVMWDYQIGLVRVTPFFKACKHSKTTPAKSIKTNEGLAELAHSITGGALAAQGYWMPYACARAVCLTFCYTIRWALTPVFGPDFIKECLTPDDPGYCRFKIDPQLVLDAAQEVKCRKLGTESRSGSPADSKGHLDIPRSMPANVIAGKDLRPRKEKKPSFPSSSPFASESDASHDRHYSHKAPAARSPSLSPKSSHRDFAGAGWTSINHNRYGASASPPRAQDNTLAGALLTEPRYSPTISWRDAEPLPPNEAEAANGCADAADAEQHDDDASRESLQDCANDCTVDGNKSSSGSESDDMDIAISPPRKRTSLARSTMETLHSKDIAKSPKKFNAVEARAAQWLLNLSARDAELAAESNPARGLKRKSSAM